jgi:nucleoside-diphosphate-sugar epimerase
MNVLVTGGLGFIGSNVVLQLLKKDISVIVADLENKKNKEKLLNKIGKIGKKANAVTLNNWTLQTLRI